MMHSKDQDILRAEPICASAPCRMDMGGTLDISSFYYPLAVANPCTFNIALALRTRVALAPFDAGYVKITSRGFADAVFPAEELPFDHPMGLMFAIAAYFGGDGIHLHIASGSPPRSALGGSSVAAVALIAAFNRLREKSGNPVMPKDRIPLLAHGIEESVAGVPCGLQDQLAAVYGGVNAWYWKGVGADAPYTRQRLLDAARYPDLSRHLLLAYCGIPHESKNINGIWVRRFLSGKDRSRWTEIARCTRDFIQAIDAFDISAAVDSMNRETDLRREMTPDVLDAMGEKLTIAARDRGCGARFTGAGGGGCVWAIGDAMHIRKLSGEWAAILKDREAGRLLDVMIDADGLRLETPLAMHEQG